KRRGSRPKRSQGGPPSTNGSITVTKRPFACPFASKGSGPQNRGTQNGALASKHGQPPRCRQPCRSPYGRVFSCPPRVRRYNALVPFAAFEVDGRHLGRWTGHFSSPP